MLCMHEKRSIPGWQVQGPQEQGPDMSVGSPLTFVHTSSFLCQMLSQMLCDVGCKPALFEGL